MAARGLSAGRPNNKNTRLLAKAVLSGKAGAAAVASEIEDAAPPQKRTCCCGATPKQVAAAGGIALMSAGMLAAAADPTLLEHPWLTGGGGTPGTAQMPEWQDKLWGNVRNKAGAVVAAVEGLLTALSALGVEYSDSLHLVSCLPMCIAVMLTVWKYTRT